MFGEFHAIPDNCLGVTLAQTRGLDEICLVRLSENDIGSVSTLAELKNSLETREDLADVDPQSIFVIVYKTSKKEGGKILVRLGTSQSFGPDMVLYHFNQLRVYDPDQLIFS